MYKIFIVEDDADLAGVMEKQIESWGNTVHCAGNLQEIMPEFTEFDPHLVMLDIMLPFYNGYHWCTQIRKVSNVPIIFLSSAADNMNIVMAMNMGGDDFIPKPVDLNVLTAKIQAMLRRTYDPKRLYPKLQRTNSGANQKRVPYFANLNGKQGKNSKP